MDVVNTFKSNMINWLCEIGLPNIEIDFEEDFGYAFDPDTGRHCINFGVVDYAETGKWFEQFCYEYGCDFVGIPAPVMSFLHECGHAFTLASFSDQELWLCEFSKAFNHGESDQEWLNKYWEIPDEFAANIWAINFINNHIEAVEELCSIYIKDWPAIFEEITIEELVKEVA